MTSIKLCAALAATLAVSAAGAAMAQAYGPDQPGDTAGYGPPPSPDDSNRLDAGQGYGPPPPPPGDQGRLAGQGGYAAQGGQTTDPRDDYDMRMARYRSQQARYQRQLREYARARRDYDMQFGPGAYEPRYAPPPPPPPGASDESR